jgi:curved DNA-binding protein CbpA
MVQRCLYDVLGVERGEEDDAIKKAYRKQALQWHPGMGSVDVRHGGTAAMQKPRALR